MTRSTGGIGAVFFQLLPQRTSVAHRFLIQPGQVGRRRRRRRTQDIAQQILSANHRRSARRIAGNRQDACLRQNAAALIGFQFHTAEVRPCDTFDAVMLRQQFVQECEPGIQKIRKRAIFAQHRFKEHPRFGLHCLAQFRPPRGKLLRIRFDYIQVARLQPLTGEIVSQRGGLFIGQHALDLRRQRARRAQFAAFSQRQQLIIRHRPPQEVAQARGQFQVSNLVNLRRVRWVCVVFDAEQEVWRDEHCLNRHLHTLLNAHAFAAAALCSAGQLHQGGGFAFRHWATIGAMRKRRDDLFNTSRAGVRTADQDFPPAGLFGSGRERPNEAH